MALLASPAGGRGGRPRAPALRRSGHRRREPARAGGAARQAGAGSSCHRRRALRAEPGPRRTTEARRERLHLHGEGLAEVLLSLRAQSCSKTKPTNQPKKKTPELTIPKLALTVGKAKTNKQHEQDTFSPSLLSPQFKMSTLFLKYIENARGTAPVKTLHHEQLAATHAMAKCCLGALPCRTGVVLLV